jgi:ADP-ribose pyrophosphatase YjhB (NUDIX family)
MNNGPLSSYPFGKQVPDGDSRERHVCGSCGWIHYQNPKIVAGAVVTHEDKFLLCKRSIEPRANYWTIPAGYLEDHEAPDEGAAREAREEANADIEIDVLLGIYTIARISQVQMIYRAKLRTPEFSVGEETLEVALVDWQDIPWDELAFPTVTWALNYYAQTYGQHAFQPMVNPPAEDFSFHPPTNFSPAK